MNKDQRDKEQNGGSSQKGHKMTVEEAGSKGGQARAEKYSKEELSEQAKRGAQTIEEERPGFHSEIGQKGGRARSESSSSQQGQKGSQGGSQKESEKDKGK